MKNIILLGITLILSSCYTHKVTLKELKSKDANYQMSYDAMRRGAIVSFDKNGKLKLLSEVQPDAAIAQTTDITNKLTAKLKTGDSISADQLTKITENLTVLGERTAAVNILRDALYRLEEHCINFECDGKNYWDRYDNVINAVTELQKQISKQKEEEASRANAEKAELDIFSKLSAEEKKLYKLSK